MSIIEYCTPVKASSLWSVGTRRQQKIADYLRTKLGPKLLARDSSGPDDLELFANIYISPEQLQNRVLVKSKVAPLVAGIKPAEAPSFRKAASARSPFGLSRNRSTVVMATAVKTSFATRSSDDEPNIEVEARRASEKRTGCCPAFSGDIVSQPNAQSSLKLRKRSVKAGKGCTLVGTVMEHGGIVQADSKPEDEEKDDSDEEQDDAMLAESLGALNAGKQHRWMHIGREPKTLNLDDGDTPVTDQLRISTREREERDGICSREACSTRGERVTALTVIREDGFLSERPWIRTLTPGGQTARTVWCLSVRPPWSRGRGAAAAAAHRPRIPRQTQHSCKKRERKPRRKRARSTPSWPRSS